MSGFKIAIFSLNQWALDFTGNVQRIIRSIDDAQAAGALYRAGPELEICGYSIEDAYYESDTVYHSWKCLLDVMKHSAKLGMVIDIGMPVHNSALYNCRVLIYLGKILCIRAKTSLANDGNYREARHFTPWMNSSGVTPYKLPNFVAKELGQSYVPFGSDFIIELSLSHESIPLRIGWDICQELWDIKNISSDLYHHYGCHLIVNSSGSYWELRKLDQSLVMIRDISQRGRACYAFSNCVGCDGQRYVFSGRSCIFNNGQLVAMTPTSSANFKEVQMITHTIYPSQINEHRAMGHMRPQVASRPAMVWDLLDPPMDVTLLDNKFKIFSLAMKYNNPASGNLSTCLPTLAISFEQEINLFVPLWLWDYLRRSSMIGFMMPLSGGLDSSTVAILVYSMCNHLYQNLDEPHVVQYFVSTHKMDPKRIKQELSSPKVICTKLLRCSYLSTKYSSRDTQRRARVLCETIGADFIDISIQDVYSSFRAKLTSKESPEVSLLDQNLQARLRMSATYYLSGGDRIVLATGNVDEAIMGYLTKYDCSSADINPIGGLCKNDLKSYLNYCCSTLFSSNRDFVDIVHEIIGAPPSAELTGAEQRDEDEIGVTYNEISILGKIRRGFYGCCGPKGAFELVWRNRLEKQFQDNIRCLNDSKSKDSGQMASELASLIKKFYQRYSRNRHKLTVLTPALHAETYSPDDNRYDHRHFLYAPWTEQFESIDRLVEKIQSGRESPQS